MAESTSQTLGRYTIHAELGKGGFATVYRATDTALERDVALKILKPGWTDDAKAVERFMREAKQASRLKHANIVTIFDVGQAEGRLFIAMELVRGRSLQQIITEDGAIAWPRMLAILEQSAAALDYAHAEGLVHRDIKPANIILDESKLGSAVYVMLADFGLVRGAEQASLSMGSTGGLLGTPEYLAPEIWDGETATKASDIYALGCVAYFLLTGKMLFGATTPVAVLKRHVEGPVFPEQWPGGVPARAEAVLRRALAKDPNQRQASAAEFVAELRACEEQTAREQEAKQKDETEHAAQIAVSAEAARRAEEERTAKEETYRKAREEQERQRQAELATQAAAEKAKQEAAEKAKRDAEGATVAAQIRRDAEEQHPREAEEHERQETNHEASAETLQLVEYAKPEEVRNKQAAQGKPISLKSFDIGIWLWWTVLTALGFVGGWWINGTFLVSMMMNGEAWQFSFWRGVVTGVAIGLCLGLLQWIALRRRLPVSIWRWLPLNLAGWITGFAIGWAITSGQPIVVGSVIIGVVTGGSIGLAQWIVFQKHVYHSTLWILASITAWTIVTTSEVLFLVNTPIPSVVGFAVEGSIGGAITGGMLVYLLRHPRPVN